MANKDKDFVNPIDKDKVAQNPGLLEYAHHIGSGKITKPDRSKIQGRSLQRMYEQTDDRMLSLQKRMHDLMQEAQELQHKMYISEKIYATKLSFQPEIGHTYSLYERRDRSYFLSMIHPHEWNAKANLQHVATVKLLSDYTWRILDKNDKFFDQFASA